MAKFTTDGISFLEVSQDLLNKFPSSLLSVMKGWYGNVYAIGLSNLTEQELQFLVMSYKIATNPNDFLFLCRDIESKAVCEAFS